MVTARVLVTDALDLLGIHASEEPLTAHQEQQGLRVLNNLLESASLEHFLIYHMPPQVVPWPGGAPMQTWGLGGNIVTPRPLQIGQQASYVDPQSQQKRPLQVLELAEYRQLPLRNSLGPLLAVSYAPNLPLGELYAYPIPMQALEVTVYPWQVLTSWEDFDAEVLMPPGYDRFLKSAVACDLAPFYDKSPSETVVAIRSESKNAIKTVNVTVPLLEVPWFADPYHRYGVNDY